MSAETAPRVARGCFQRGLIIETCGREDRVLKALPALTIWAAEIDEGVDIIEDALAAATRR